METENQIRINVDAICVLKFAPNSNLVIVDYLPITRTLDTEIEQLVKLFEISYKDAKSILNSLKNNYKLKVLLSRFSYCRSLSAPFQGLYLDIEQIEEKYPSNFSNKSDRAELIKKEKESLLFDLQERLQAYYLQEAYKICEKGRLQKSILAYSHRKDGWATPKYELNSNFSIEIKTNFGYGHVSYFYTRIQFKGIDIIPFSDWIKYEKAQLFEIIRYSAKHQLKNESWKEALEYSRDACNLSISDETAFIKTYIIEECERMVSGLELILNETKFQFLVWDKKDEKNWKQIFTDVHKDGHNLIEFRGMKISGALDFIEKIVHLNKVIEIGEFVDRIENCNKIVKPILSNEIELIELELLQLNVDIEILKPIYLELEKQNKIYEDLKNVLREQEKNNKDTSIFNTKMQEIEERFKEQNLQYEQKKKEYNALIDKIKSLEITKENIVSYGKAIETYFNNKILQTI
jgi:hypothetical protein